MLSGARAYCTPPHDSDGLLIHFDGYVPAPTVDKESVVRVLYSKQAYPTSATDPTATQLEEDRRFRVAGDLYLQGAGEYLTTYYFSAFVGARTGNGEEIAWEPPLN